MSLFNRPDKAGQSRREFLKTSSLALAGTAMASSLGLSTAAAATSGTAGARSRLGVALVGTGNRCQSLLRECLRNRDEWQLDFPAICDVWRPNLEQTAERIESETGRRPKTFSRYQEMLEMEEIDCVIVATPDFTHTPVLVAAADAGKAVYVEKPMAVSIEQANAALDAAQRNNTVVQAGTQYRSAPHFAEAAVVVQSGELGRLIKIDCHYHRPEMRWDRPIDDVHEEDVDWEQYLGHLPSRPFDAHRFRCWHLYRDYTVGLMGLLGTHVLDVAAWFAGADSPSSSTGLEAWLTGQTSETADFQEALFTYDDNFVINCGCRSGNGTLGTQATFYGTRGTMHCPMSPNQNILVTPEGASDSNPVKEREIEAQGWGSHLANWFDSVREGTPATNADIEAGYAHSVASVLAVEAMREGRHLRFNESVRQVSAR